METRNWAAQGSPGRKRAFLATATILSVLGMITALVLALPISKHDKFGLLLIPIAMVAVNRWPALSVCGFIAVLPFDASYANNRLSYAVPAIMLIVLILGVARGRWLPAPSMVALGCLLIGWMLISLGFNNGELLVDSPKVSVYLISASIVVGIFCSAAKPPIEGLVASIAASGVLVSLALVSGTAAGLTHSVQSFDTSGLDRISALGLNPNYLGLIVAVSIVATAGLASSLRLPILLIATVPNWVALAELKSRGSLLIIAIGLLIVYIVGRGLRVRAMIIAGVFISLSVYPTIVTGLQNRILGGRLQTDLAESTYSRLLAARLALRLSLEYPLFGIGYLNFPSFAIASPSLGLNMNTHDDYLRLAAEVGIPALVFFVGIIVNAMLATKLIPFGIAALAIFCSVAYGLTNMNGLVVEGMVIGFWALMGSAIGIARDVRRGIGAEDLPTWWAQGRNIGNRGMTIPPLAGHLE